MSQCVDAFRLIFYFCFYSVQCKKIPSTFASPTRIVPWTRGGEIDASSAVSRSVSLWAWSGKVSSLQTHSSQFRNYLDYISAIKLTAQSSCVFPSREDGQSERTKRTFAIQAQSRPGRVERGVSSQHDRLACAGAHRLEPWHWKTGLFQGRNKEKRKNIPYFLSSSSRRLSELLCCDFSTTRQKSVRTRRRMRATSSSFTTFSRPPWRSSGHGRGASQVSPSSAQKTRSCCWSRPSLNSSSCVLHIGESSFPQRTKSMLSHVVIIELTCDIRCPKVQSRDRQADLLQRRCAPQGSVCPRLRRLDRLHLGLFSEPPSHEARHFLLLLPHSAGHNHR